MQKGHMYVGTEMMSEPREGGRGILMKTRRLIIKKGGK
jgi:hypothetical protein